MHLHCHGELCNCIQPISKWQLLAGSRLHILLGFIDCAQWVGLEVVPTQVGLLDKVRNMTLKSNADHMHCNIHKLTSTS